MYCKKCKCEIMEFRCLICETVIEGECYEHHNERIHPKVLELIAERDVIEDFMVSQFDSYDDIKKLLTDNHKKVQNFLAGLVDELNKKIKRQAI